MFSRFFKGVLLTLAIPALCVSVSFSETKFTILHTNDFHGQLQASGSNPGLARVAAVVNAVRATVGASNTLLVDTGDAMQGSLLSNLEKGEPTVAAFSATPYDAAAIGNHEFDWGQTTLAARAAQATYPFLGANVVSGACSADNWTAPTFAQPYVIKSVAGITVAFIGVTTTETPTLESGAATAGLCFKDPAAAILHYYDTLKAAADVIVVLSHLGYSDGGYGYGIPVYGDQTLANMLITAGKPVPLIIGGHSHTNLASATVVGGVTTVVQAYYNGRKVGRADLTLKDDKSVTVAWQRLDVSTSGAEDPTVKAVIDTYANDPAYLALVNQPVCYSAVDLPRNGGTADNMMGTFIDDALYNALNHDGESDNDVDIFFNNAGGLRTDWCAVADPANPGQFMWSSNSADCHPGTHDPILLNYAHLFSVLPFGNAAVVGSMTGAQILEVLNYGPKVTSGVIQPSGLKFKYYGYKDAASWPLPYAWGAFDFCVVNKTTGVCEPLDLKKTYRVGTNEFLAPAGGDGYGGFRYMTNVTYWGDMLNHVCAWVSATYGTPATAYRGPNGNGTLDGRILRDGTDTPDSGTIRPITILHHNDSHGNLVKGAFVGYTQLATLIRQERLHNPERTILLSAGDQIQGDEMMFHFRTAPQGYAADGTPVPPGLQQHPMIAAMNLMGYDALTLGNHDFNFGSQVFTSVFKQATFSLLGANVSDTGQYGLVEAGGVLPSVVETRDGVKVAILGLTNHRVPNYELPTNIEGLTFLDPITTAQTAVPSLRAGNDVVVALTHIGFTLNPHSAEVDSRVDTELAAQVEGIDAIIGGHSHSNPAMPEAPFKGLPALISSPGGAPVLVNQAYRYNNTLGEVILGVRAKAGGGYEVVSRVGQYLSVNFGTAEDPETKALLDPYVTALNANRSTTVGSTTVPLDTLNAFTQETNGANLQADASVNGLAAKGIPANVHLAGAITNRLVASGATPASPVTLTRADMYTFVPYEDYLVTLRMTGPELKTVLERAYRNYFYYKYVPGYGGYSYYTTCMLDVNSNGKILYRDTYPALPNGNNVVGLLLNGVPVDFADSTRQYLVSTVNYLAAGSCNFNDGGTSLWPLNEVVNDTQYYVRDAVIDHTKNLITISPVIDGRLVFSDTTTPVVTISSPAAADYLQTFPLPITFTATDAVSGVRSVSALLDTAAVANGQTIPPNTLAAGPHTLTVTAVDFYDNPSTQSVSFNIYVTASSISDTVNAAYTSGKIKNKGILDSLLAKLEAAKAALAAGDKKTAANILNALVSATEAQKGKGIDAATADLLIADAQWLISHL